MVTLLSLLRDFADETGIFGLHLFKRKRSTFDVIFWSAFVLIFSCYTTKTVITICANYVGEEVSTVVQQSRLENFTFPQPEIALSGDLFLDNSSFGLRSELEEYFSTGHLNNGSFLNSLTFVNQIREIEKSIARSSDVPDVLKKSNFHFGLHAFADQAQSMVTFENYVLARFCHALGVSIYFSGCASSIDICGRRTIGSYFLANDSIFVYLQLDERRFQFRNAEDELEISLNLSAVREKLGFSVNFVQFNVDYGDAFTEPDGRFEIVKNTNRRYFLRVTSVYRNLDLRRRPCLTDRVESVFC